MADFRSRLEQDLVRAARRPARLRYARSPLPSPAALRTVALAVAPVATVVVVAALLLSSSSSPQHIPGDERAVPSPTSVATPAPPSRIASIDPKTGHILPSYTPLERTYSVFRAPPTTRDIPPFSAQQRTSMGRGCGRAHRKRICLRPETARVVHRGDGIQVFVMQGDRGDDLCTVAFERAGYEVGCTTANAKRLAEPTGAYSQPHKSQPAHGYTVFPDGVERAAYTFADGTVDVRDVVRNLAYVSGPAAITSLSWTVGDRRYVHQLVDFDPNDPALSAACPKLDPLPPAPDGQATQTAQTAASAIYAITPGEITATRVRPATIADVDKTRRRACGEGLVERSLVVDLTFTDHRPGSLLVGFRDGAPIVWTQIG
jgi:hypothetical protein